MVRLGANWRTMPYLKSMKTTCSCLPSKVLIQESASPRPRISSDDGSSSSNTCWPLQSLIVYACVCLFSHLPSRKGGTRLNWSTYITRSRKEGAEQNRSEPFSPSSSVCKCTVLREQHPSQTGFSLAKAGRRPRATQASFTKGVISPLLPRYCNWVTQLSIK